MSRGLHCWIEGAEVSLDKIHYRELNFGQTSDVPDAETLGYELKIPVEVLVQGLVDEYNEFAADDRQYGGEDEEPEILQLRAQGWPKLSTLFDENPASFQFVALELSYAALGALFGTAKTPQYFINSVSDVAVQGRVVAFRGEVLSLL